jgi:hypothetical protein
VCVAKPVKIHGFVTAFNSPTSFEIEDYKITRDTTLVMDVEKEDDGELLATFRPEDIRIGTELEIKGNYDESTSELKATVIKVFLDDTRTIKRVALLEKPPMLRRGEAGWIGIVAADGQKVSLNESTLVSVRLNKSEKKHAVKGTDQTSPLLSTDQLTLDTFMRYEGVRQADGAILAKRVEFQHAELEDGEAKMWKELTPKVKSGDFSSFKPGELRMEKTKYKLVPSKDAQDYIATLGESIIPARQRDLATGSDLKIPFRFFLVEDKSFNATCYPNGVVVVNSGVFDVADNEAQLAFVLSHEITHAIEKHLWREHEYHKNALMALRIGGAVGAAFGGQGISNMTTLIEAGVRNGYARSLENQADRVGLEWMIASGYDIREAPEVWKAVSQKYGDHRTNFFWDNHDNNTTRRSYLMSEIRNNYADVDFSSLRKDTGEFHKVAAVVQEAAAGKKKIKLRTAK